MARKKIVKDVEAEGKVKKSKKDEIEEEVTEVEVENQEEVEEIDTRIDDDDDFEDEEVEEKNTKKDKKGNKEKKQTKKDGYFKQVGKELKKVVWPKGSDIIKYSFAVIIFCVVLCLFFVGIDFIASLVKGLFV